MLSNNGIDVWNSFARWVPHQIGERPDILVAIDWTDFDHDDQATLALHLVTGHDRQIVRWLHRLITASLHLPRATWTRHSLRCC